MKKTFLLLVILFCQLIFGQEDYSKYKPVEPLYDNGSVAKFYEYLSKTINLSKVQNEKDVIIAFILGKDGKMNHIKVGFCSSVEVEKEITSALQNANTWDLSNQKDKDYFICYKMKLLFSDKEVKGLTKTMWFKQDIQNIIIDKNEFNALTQNEKVVLDELYNSAGVEIKPEYPGGIEAFYKYIQKKFKAPTDRNFKGGRVIVGFVVERDGSLTDIRVAKHVGFGTDKEAIRVLENCKKWKPAMQKGVAVRCSYMLPITLQSN